MMHDHLQLNGDKTPVQKVMCSYHKKVRSNKSESDYMADIWQFTSLVLFFLICDFSCEQNTDCSRQWLLICAARMVVL